MELKYLTDSAIEAFIEAALREDVGDGDHSSLASVPADAVKKAKLLIKDEGIIAGVALAEKILRYIDPTTKVTTMIQDGEEVKYGDVAMIIEGHVQAILKAERLILNCMQRMSGIATHTDKIVKMVEGTKAVILDTRKTTPNFRLMEKWAVYIGKGTNHRFGLFDLIMLKDNHVDYAGGVAQAVQATQKYLKETGRDLRIELETRNLEEVKEALKVGGIDVLMLDNMSTEEMKEAVEVINGQCKTEASGGITEENVREVAETGVDFISMGALTHSSQSLDISLKAIK